MSFGLCMAPSMKAIVLPDPRRSYVAANHALAQTRTLATPTSRAAEPGVSVRNSLFHKRYTVIHFG